MKSKTREHHIKTIFISLSFYKASKALLGKDYCFSQMIDDSDTPLSSRLADRRVSVQSGKAFVPPIPPLIKYNIVEYLKGKRR